MYTGGAVVISSPRHKCLTPSRALRLARSRIDIANQVDSLLSEMNLLDYQATQLRALGDDRRMILRICSEVLARKELVFLVEPFLSFSSDMIRNVSRLGSCVCNAASSRPSGKEIGAVTIS